MHVASFLYYIDVLDRIWRPLGKRPTVRIAEEFVPMYTPPPNTRRDPNAPEHHPVYIPTYPEDKVLGAERWTVERCGVERTWRIYYWGKDMQHI